MSTPLITDININDVLCGRGGKINSYSGNVQFRKLVNRNKSTYVSVKKHEKANVARMIIDTIKSMNPPGRFLKESDDGTSWIEIPSERILKKTKQALREPEVDAEGSAATAAATVTTTITTCTPDIATSGVTFLRSPEYIPEPLPKSRSSVDNHYLHSQPLVSSNLPFSTNHNDLNMVSCSTMGQSSCSSIDTNSTLPTFNSRRRQYFRDVKACSLESLVSESEHSNNINEEELMKESLASISMGIQSMDIQSMDIQSMDIQSMDIQSMEMQSFGDISLSANEMIQFVGAA